MSGLKDDDPEAAEPAPRRSLSVTELMEAEVRAILESIPDGPGYDLAGIPQVPPDGGDAPGPARGPRTA